MDMGVLTSVLLMMYYSGVGLPLGVPPAEQDPLMLRVAPEKCLYYTTWSGMAKPDSGSGNATEALLAEPELQRFVVELDKAITEGIARAEGDPEAAMLARLAPLLGKTLLTNATAIYIDKLKLREGGPPDIQAGLIVNSGDQTTKIRDAMVEFQSHQLGDEVKEIELAGETFYQFRPAADAPLITWGVKGRYLLLGAGEGAVEAMLASARTGPPAWLTELTDKLPVARTSTITYADLGAIINAGLGGMPPEDAAKAKRAVAALGLANVTSYASVTGLDKKGFVNRTLVSIEGESRGLFELTDAKPLTAAELSPIPRDATMAAAFRLNSRKVLDIVQSVAREADPHTADQIDEGLDALAKMLKMDLREELLAGLGETWSVYNSAGEGGLLFTGLTVTVDLKDKAQAEKAYKQLMALAAAALREPNAEDDGFSRRRPLLKSIEFQGKTIYYLTGLDDFPFAPAWCLTDTHLVASLFPQNIEALLARGGDYQSLAAAPEVAEQLAARPLAVTYFDTKTLFEILYPIAQIAATAALNNLSEEGLDADVAMLPRADTIARHLRPSVTTMARTERGLEFTTEQVLPGGSAGTTTPIAVALLLPAVQSARLAARRVQSMNNLKQISLAHHNHAATFARLPPAALKTKDGKPGLSWRVKILPFIEQQALYDQFRLDEPWDSEHNKKLIDKLPMVYRSPASAAPPGYTTYLGVVGKDGIFSGDEKGTSFAAVRDGLSNTLMVVEVNDRAAVPWTKPDDFDPADGMKPTSQLEGVWRGVFLGGMGDGSVHAISTSVDPKTLMALFTKSGGEVIGAEDLRGGPPRGDRAPDVGEKPAPKLRGEAVEEFEAVP